MSWPQCQNQHNQELDVVWGRLLCGFSHIIIGGSWLEDNDQTRQWCGIKWRVYINHFNRKSIRKGMLYAIFNSILGCLFLILSIVNVFQIRLGILSCRSPSIVQGVVALVVIVTCGVVFHVAITILAFLYVWLLVYIHLVVCMKTLLIYLIITQVFGFVCIHLVVCLTYYKCV